ncbi:MAG: transcriptional regulator [Chloroflexi bacterium]|nr:transcriptional regulator [Chloroflexota bacterium]
MSPTAAGQLNVLTLLAQGMGPDLHWFPEDVAISRLAAVLVGLANTSGGTLLLGVGPRSGRVQGLSDPQTAKERVLQAALLCDPALVLPMPSLHPAGEGQVLLVNVPAGLPQIYNLEGRYLGREGSHTVPISARGLNQLFSGRSEKQFESRVPRGAALKHLNIELVQSYLSALNLPGDQKWEEILLQRGCLVKVGKKLKPNYAALMLFGKHPQRWLPSASILAARFQGVTSKEDNVEQDIDGPLPQQIEKAEMFVRQNLKNVVRVIGLRYEKTPEFPYAAVRELLVNAAAHRDYQTHADNIHLNIFSDRLEITSPGGLVGPVNLKNLLNVRFSRNAVIAQVLADLGFGERMGYGLNRVVSAMRQNGLHTPRFEESGDLFRVRLYGAPFQAAKLPDLSAYENLGLNFRQQLALGYLASHARITSRVYQDLCPEVHPETLRRDMIDLVRCKVLVKVGEKRATYYKLKSITTKKVALK